MGTHGHGVKECSSYVIKAVNKKTLHLTKTMKMEQAEKASKKNVRTKNTIGLTLSIT